MHSTFRRAALLGGTALAMGLLAAGARAQVTDLQGEGSSLASPTYSAEFKIIPGDTHYAFTEYSTSSGKGQAAFTANVGTAVSGVPSGQAVDWGASDAAVNSTFQTGWDTASTGLPEAGPFIQIPMLGVGIAIPFNDPGLETNTALKLDDDDLCGIFSGKITTWDALSHPVKGVTGPFKVYYRADGSGTTFLLLQHLAALRSPGQPVCNSSNSNITFSVTTTFASLFPSGVPSNFVGELGSAGEATAIQNDTSGSGGTPSALGYLSPDYTDVVATPAPGFGTLRAASVINDVNNVAYQPTYQYIALALARPGYGATDQMPPPVKNAGNQLLWAPTAPIATAGYDISGYSNWLLATCYADTNVGSGLIEFLTDHFKDLAVIVVNDSGFVVPGQTVIIGSKKVTNPDGQAYVKAIEADFLANPGAGNLGIDSSKGCAKYPGRPNHSGP